MVDLSGMQEHADARRVERLEEALQTMGMVCADLKNQRDAREDECAELRGHVRNLLEIYAGKVRSREISRRVRAAQEYLARPRRSWPERGAAPPEGHGHE